MGRGVCTISLLLRPDRSLQQSLLQQQNCGQQTMEGLITAAPALSRRSAPTPLSAVNQRMCRKPPPTGLGDRNGAPSHCSGVASWGKLLRAPSPSRTCQGPPLAPPLSYSLAGLSADFFVPVRVWVPGQQVWGLETSLPVSPDLLGATQGGCITKSRSRQTPFLEPQSICVGMKVSAKGHLIYLLRASVSPSLKWGSRSSSLLG